MTRILDGLTWVVVAVSLLLLWSVIKGEPGGSLFQVFYLAVMAIAVVLVTAGVAAPRAARVGAPIALGLLLFVRGSRDDPREAVTTPGTEVPACIKAWTGATGASGRKEFPTGVVYAAERIPAQQGWVFAITARVIQDTVRAHGRLPVDPPSAVAAFEEVAQVDQDVVRRAVEILHVTLVDADSAHMVRIWYCGVDRRCGTCDDVVGEFLVDQEPEALDDSAVAPSG